MSRQETLELLWALKDGISGAIPAAQRLARHEDPQVAALGSRMDNELHSMWASADDALTAAKLEGGLEPAEAMERR